MRYPGAVSVKGTFRDRRTTKQADALRQKTTELFYMVKGESSEVVFHKIYGRLERFTVDGKTYVTAGPEVTVYRATIDNDMYKKDDWLNKYFIQPDEQTEYFRTEERGDRIDVMIGTYFGCLNQSWGFLCDYHYTVYGDGSVTCRLEGKQIQRGKAEPDFYPRIGIQMKAAKELQNAAWYGLGFQENYADSRKPHGWEFTARCGRYVC